MKFCLLVILLILTSNVASQEYMLLPVVDVYDGDTIKTDLSWRLPYPLSKVSIRIYGIDTPEMPAKSYAITGKLNRAKCVKEAEMALIAKARVVELVGSGQLKISNFKWGRNGGRIVAVVKVNGIDIGATLIKEGLAVEYFGKGKKQDWCQ